MDDKKTFFILYANPNEKSFCHSFLEKASDSITKRCHNLIVSDLYKMNFNPVLGPNDFKERENKDELKAMNEQLYSYQNGNLADDIKEEIEKLQKADYVILIFPIWWGSVPAIMKGWFDRILVNGFGWTMEKLFKTGPLLGKRASIISVCAGSEEEYSKNGDHLQNIEEDLCHVTLGTLGFCGFDVLPIHNLFACFDCGKDKIDQFINEIDNIIENFGTSKLLYQQSKNK